MIFGNRMAVNHDQDKVAAKLTLPIVSAPSWVHEGGSFQLVNRQCSGSF